MDDFVRRPEFSMATVLCVFLMTKGSCVIFCGIVSRRISFALKVFARYW